MITRLLDRLYRPTHPVHCLVCYQQAYVHRQARRTALGIVVVGFVTVVGFVLAVTILYL